MKFKIILAFYFIFGNVQAQNFKAAVVEYAPYIANKPVIPHTRLMKNVENYKKLATDNKDNYDIIVFPESTLSYGGGFEKSSDVFPYSTIIPNSGEVPCDDADFTIALHLKELSCLAKSLKKYIVVNLPENVPCAGSENCPAVGYHTYNTNVVFDRAGKVAAKYNKYNLFGEKYMSKPNKQLTTFEINDVKVGTFICFDIIFSEPAIDLVKKEKVQVVVYPLLWFSELPFLTALQAQQQWAHEMGVTLLAAGGNRPITGTGGTGIFKGKEGLIVGTITSDTKSQIFYRDLSSNTNKPVVTLVEDIDNEAKSLDRFFLLKDDLKSYSSKLLIPNGDSVEEQVCSGKENNKICCDFHIKTNVNQDILNDDKNHYHYHMVAFSGVRTFSGVATGGLEICAVIACVNDTVRSCGERFKDYDSISWPITFTKIEVEANFVKDARRIQFPNSVLSNLRPLPTTETEWSTKEDGDVVNRKHVLIKSQSRLLTFGIFGRDFNRDGDEVTRPEDNKDKNNGKDKDPSGSTGSMKLHLSVLTVACLLMFINCFW